ncbi:putative ferrochelatase [Gordonia hirsuta DSM 44140 = NBRC 16056]|uniref:Putative ferrochelatase n=1 Tax=Gordonia hirsuta DSM 44140 = NBRC 16056 TaxID=1121927 RepID=L7L8V0_9ACTN|nr:putative ferrochelatase [Gordonia hirsuta DSM 44140 = NBRC 16056]
MLVLAAHGSRDVRFAATSERVTDAVRRALPGVRVELAYLDLNVPLLDDVLDALDGEVVVVPLLFGDGFHSKTDLPAMLEAARLRNPRLRPVQTPIVGRYSPVPALIERLEQALGRTPSAHTGDGVLLYAVGSSDPASDASIHERGRELAAVLGVPVHTVFATRLGRDGAVMAAATDYLRACGARQLVASPLFLSAGLLTERVERELDAVWPGATVAGPIGEHPSLIAAIARLYRDAVPRAMQVGAPAPAGLG